MDLELLTQISPWVTGVIGWSAAQLIGTAVQKSRIDRLEVDYRSLDKKMEGLQQSVNDLDRKVGILLDRCNPCAGSNR